MSFNIIMELRTSYSEWEAARKPISDGWRMTDFRKIRDGKRIKVFRFHAASSFPETAVKGECSTLSILLVDGSLDSRFHIRSLLTRAGYKDVTALQSCREAKRVLTQSNPLPCSVDLIIIHFDELGLELCGLFQQHSHTRETPIIALTDEEDNELIRLAFGMGIRDLLTLPLQPEAFVAKVRQQLRFKYERDGFLAQQQQMQEVAQQLQEANLILQKLSSLDGLTGVMNRRSFDELLVSEWKRAARDGYGLSLVLVDIDFFKQFNDLYGHVKGDECLKRVAAALEANLKRAGDAVARFGGEEFVAVLPNTDEEGAEQVAETLRQAILELNIPHEDSVVHDTVTVSCGTATLHPNIWGNPEHLLAMTDEALYEAKRSGRNRMVAYGTKTSRGAAPSAPKQDRELQAVKNQLRALERLVRSTLAPDNQSKGTNPQRTLPSFSANLTPEELRELRKLGETPNQAADEDPESDQGCKTEKRRDDAAGSANTKAADESAAAAPEDGPDDGSSQHDGSQDHQGDTDGTDGSDGHANEHVRTTAIGPSKDKAPPAAAGHENDERTPAAVSQQPTAENSAAHLAAETEQSVWTPFFDQTSHAVVQVDTLGQIVQGNPTFFLSFWPVANERGTSTSSGVKNGLQAVADHRRRDGIGLPLQQLLSKEDREHLQQALQDVLDGSLVTVTVDARTAAGSSWWQWEIMKLGSDTAPSQGALLFGRDITAAKELEEKLALRTKMLKQLSNLG